MSDAPRPLPLHELTGGWNREDEGVAYESHLCRRLATVLGLQRIVRQAPGGKITSLRAFNKFFRTFPVEMSSLCSRSAKKVTLLRMMQSPLNQPPVKRFYDCLGESSDGEYVALFVRMDGFADGLAFHNMFDLRRQATQLVIRPPKAKPVCVEKFDQFVKYAVRRTGWEYTPED